MYDQHLYMYMYSLKQLVRVFSVRKFIASVKIIDQVAVLYEVKRTAGVVKCRFQQNITPCKSAYISPYFVSSVYYNKSKA